MSNVFALPSAPEETDLSELLRRNVRAEIARAGLQQAEVARALGISQQSVSLKLSGRRPISVDEINAFAHLFGIAPYKLLWAPWGSNPQPAD
jgi:transcriptional regulator with XRE-family HTH domain